jgi:glyoxylase-like metal-dependent hydrolase (beta-lactamase superfamily II)
MHEIAPHVFIESSYPGVTLGAINWPHGLILIDAPLRPDDIRLWRTTLANMSGGMDRLLVNLDEHFDRTIGSRQVECMVAGHEKLAIMFRDRPVTFKAQTVETGADWELQNGLGSIRWAPPEISFSHELIINWDENPIHLKAQPGPSVCSIWVELPAQKLIFVGDTVIPNAPPFLGAADLPAWKTSIDLLLSPRYRDYKVISGRGGEVHNNDIKNQEKFLEKVEHQLERIVEKKGSVDEIDKSVHQLLKSFSFRSDKEEHYQLRLRWGLQQYLKLHNELNLSAGD